VALASTEKEEARPLGQASPFPSIFSPESRGIRLVARRRQISGFFELCVFKKINVAETSRSCRTPLTPRQKAPKIADF
jgi:hypothetical protein